MIPAEVRKLEEITGLDVRWFPERRLLVGFLEGRPVVNVSGRELDAAYDRFLFFNLNRVRELLRAKSNGRCVWCGRRRPLQLDHVVMRSRHRDDRIENCRLLCPECHERRHLPQ